MKNVMKTERKNVFKHGPYPAVVAVVTTLYMGIVNAAPITWFSPISYDPPYLMISVKKESDTAQNIIDSNKFTLQTVPYYVAQQVHNMAYDYPRDVSEIEMTKKSLHTHQLSVEKSNVLSVPHLTLAHNWYECISKSMHTIGNDHYQFVGEVVGGHCSSGSIYGLLHFGELEYGTVGANGIIFEVDPY